MTSPAWGFEYSWITHADFPFFRHGDFKEHSFPMISSSRTDPKSMGILKNRTYPMIPFFAIRITGMGNLKKEISVSLFTLKKGAAPHGTAPRFIFIFKKDFTCRPSSHPSQKESASGSCCPFQRTIRSARLPYQEKCYLRASPQS